MTVLFDNLKKYAKLRSLSVQQVALKAGMGINSLYKWNKSDYSPSDAALVAVSAVLDISKEQLTGKETKKEPQKIDLKATIDDDDVIMTYDGKPIPKEDLELIKRLMRGE